MSVVVFPPRRLDASGPDGGRGVAWLTAIGAVATAEVVTAWTGRAAAIKWPNDVRIDGRKIAGILVERPSAHAPAAVIGIGLNVHLDADDFPVDLRGRATSIRIERGGRPADRSEIARDLIRRLDHWYEAVHAQGPGALNAPWCDRSEHLGRIVRVLTPSGYRSGRIVDLDLHVGLTIQPRPGDASGQDPPVGVRERPASRLVRIPSLEVLSIEDDPDSGGDPPIPWTAGPTGS
jgi:BirA family biotin operon repressor/biotin-[acetyl-CoA-carboxylase] ligase